jgi:hypothetical protein
MNIGIPTKVQTMLESFSIVMCWWVLLELGCLGNSRGEIEWPYAFGWQKVQNFERVPSNLSRRLIHGFFVEVVL